MSRAKWKSPYIEKSLFDQLQNISKNKIIRTKSRSSIILPGFIGRMFEVYNGCRYTRIYIEESMVGSKLGAFSFTRRLGRIHTSKNKK